jgi:hypothetical protein
MRRPAYWLNVFNVETWREFNDAGSMVSGFRKTRWASVSQIQPGDFLLCYLIRVSRWVGLLEVVSQPFLGSERLWKSDLFAARVKVKPEVILSPETGIPVLSTLSRLTLFNRLSNKQRWGAAFQSSPARWRSEDGDYVATALKEAQSNPIVRPFPVEQLTVQRRR